VNTGGEEACHHETDTVTPAATVTQAARIMSRYRIGRLPVRDPLTGRLAGIVTRSDLLRIYLRPGEEIRAEIQAGVLPPGPRRGSAAAGGCRLRRRGVDLGPGRTQVGRIGPSQSHA